MEIALKISLYALAVSLSTVSVAHAATECKPPSDSMSDQIKAFFTVFWTAKLPCDSKRTVMQRLQMQAPVGGRKLEPDQAFNRAAAQADLDRALADPAIQQRFAEAKASAPTDEVRLGEEAAILDDERHYAARDLKIRELAEQLK